MGIFTVTQSNRERREEIHGRPLCNHLNNVCYVPPALTFRNSTFCPGNLFVPLV